ncbi:hypothetical protein HIM_07252 [Hirsutella minnesotensis 3608]|uniref:AB hydrolase-1 domain-containing protein n=1 Tax=Hirsutella minnesotensis 3608 TaxID=1043627 RepID=A0A0F7ZTP2_9HYPO|nr:hypothetical protein HIM_07252 [Hirsutella minnesotensis 3608]
MTTQKPSIVLIHGAWHTTAAYRTLLDMLEARGYPTVAPELPSGAAETPPDPPEADIRCAAEAIRTLVEAPPQEGTGAGSGNQVIVIAHSYGGTVATEAVAGLGLRERQDRGLLGGVRMVIYVAAFVLQEGAYLDMYAPIETVPWCEYQGNLKVFSPGRDIGAVFYPDLAPEERDKWLARCTKHPKVCSFYTPKTTSYDRVDVAYVFCERDEAFPLAGQKAMVQGLKERGVQFREATLDSGHFPMLSMPEALANLVVQFIQH